MIYVAAAAACCFYIWTEVMFDFALRCLCNIVCRGNRERWLAGLCLQLVELLCPPAYVPLQVIEHVMFKGAACSGSCKRRRWRHDWWRRRSAAHWRHGRHQNGCRVEDMFHLGMLRRIDGPCSCEQITTDLTGHKSPLHLRYALDCFRNHCIRNIDYGGGSLRSVPCRVVADA